MAENENEFNEENVVEINPEELMDALVDGTDLNETEETETPVEEENPVVEEEVTETGDETANTGNETEVNDEGYGYPMDTTEWMEEDYVETDPDLMVKDWDDSIYKEDPKLAASQLKTQSLLKGSGISLMSTGGLKAAAATGITYRKLSGNNSIAASGITVDPLSGKTLDAYIRGNAFYINGTKVLWYEADSESDDDSITPAE